MKVVNYYNSLTPNNRDKRAAKTISSIIVTLHEEGHKGSSVTACRAPMSVNSFMLATGLL